MIRATCTTDQPVRERAIQIGDPPTNNRPPCLARRPGERETWRAAEGSFLKKFQAQDCVVRKYKFKCTTIMSKVPGSIASDLYMRSFYRCTHTKQASRLWIRAERCGDGRGVATAVFYALGSCCLAFLAHAVSLVHQIRPQPSCPVCRSDR